MVTLAAAVLATGAGLALWARSVPTRALGDGAATAGRRGATLGAIAALGVLQCGAAVHAVGLAAGLASVACGWMVGGALFTLALNRWPRPTVAIALATGCAALAVCAASFWW